MDIKIVSGVTRYASFRVDIKLVSGVLDSFRVDIKLVSG